jgi:hypothetical protein
LDDLIDLSAAYDKAIAVKKDLVFNGVELVRPGIFSGISVAAWVFFQFPTVYPKDQENLPDSAGVLVVPARGSEAAVWVNQYKAKPWVSSLSILLLG